MAKQTVLLVDGDLRNLRVIEVSLRKAGYAVVACNDAEAALQAASLGRPDVVLLDTRLPQLDGFGLVSALRSNLAGIDLPFIFLSSDTSMQSQVRALELGVQDYLVKPTYITEIIARVALVLQRRQRVALEQPAGDEATRFSGSLAEMGVVDLLQTCDHGRKTGVLHLHNEEQRGALYFRQGQLVHAELGDRRGERAVYRMLLWEDGKFEFDAGEVRQAATIATSTQGVLMEGMRRVDEWDRLVEQVPDLDTVFEINDVELVERLSDIPDEVNAVLRHVNGQLTLIEVIDIAQGDDLETLSTIAKLYAEGLIYVARPRAPAASADDEPSSSHRGRKQTASYEPPPQEAFESQHGDEDDDDEDGSADEPVSSTSLRPSLTGNLRVRRGRRRRRDHVRTLNTIPPDRTSPGAVTTQSYPPHTSTHPGESAAAGRQRKRRKRLALATSPGLLSVTGMQATRVSFSPPSLASALRRVAEPELAAGPASDAPSSSGPLSSASDEGFKVNLTFESDSEPVGAPYYDDAPVVSLRPAISPPPPAMQTSQVAVQEQAHVPIEATKPPAVAPRQQPADAEPPVLSNHVTPLAHPELDDEMDAPWDMTAVTLPPSRRATRILPLAAVLSVLIVGGVLLLRISGDEGPSDEPPSIPPETSSNALGTDEVTPPAPAEGVAVDAASREAAANVQQEDPQQIAEGVEAKDSVQGEVADAGVAGSTAPQLPEAAINAILLKAQQLDREGKLSQASALYEQLLESAPQRSDILSHLAFNYLNSGRNAEAAQLATRAVAIDPTSSEGWIVLGAAKHTQGDVAGAREAYRQCVEQGTGAYVTECRRMLR